MRTSPYAVSIALGLISCGPPTELEADEPEPPQSFSSVEQGLVTCGTRQDTGYRNGSAFTITVVTADGKPIEQDSANAYAVMQAAAAAAGIDIWVVSGFRTMAEQHYLYACYTHCNCNTPSMPSAWWLSTRSTRNRQPGPPGGSGGVRCRLTQPFSTAWPSHCDRMCVGSPPASPGQVCWLACGIRWHQLPGRCASTVVAHRRIC